MWVIIMGVLMFMFLVVIHELGHFIAAKKTGVKVEEFGVGIPPKAFKFWTDKQGTEYTINRIPLGGFVRMKWENPNETETFLASDSFITAKLSHKLIILFAWVTINAIFAWLAFSLAFMHGVKPLVQIPDNGIRGESRSYLMPTYSFLRQEGFLTLDDSDVPAEINNVNPNGLGSKVGLKDGDIIKEVNGVHIEASNLSQVLKDSIGKNLNFLVLRDGDQINLKWTCPDDNCFLDIEMSIVEQQVIIQFPGTQAFVKWAQEVAEQTRVTFKVLAELGRNFLSGDKDKINSSIKGLSGPVGIVKFGGWVLKYNGARWFLAFAWMISLALAVFNVLPIPALDGGRAVWVLLQAAGRRKPEKYFVIENYFNVTFFVALMILGIYVIILDLDRRRGVNIPFIS